jgi:hypothetical protein
VVGLGRHGQAQSDDERRLRNITFLAILAILVILVNQYPPRESHAHKTDMEGHSGLHPSFGWSSDSAYFVVVVTIFRFQKTNGCSDIVRSILKNGLAIHRTPK